MTVVTADTNTRAMDSASSEHSTTPLSENAVNSWLHWENEISSISGLNIGSTSELNGLVEDKEVAARAVALVVNSTRKGIVPLCSDIASLLRAKRSLEKKVYLLKREVEAIRSSTSVSFRTSHSTSPTPPFLDKPGCEEPQVPCNVQESSRPCSQCSQCSASRTHKQQNLSSLSVSQPPSIANSPCLPRTQHSEIGALNGGDAAKSKDTASSSACTVVSVTAESSTQNVSGTSTQGACSHSTKRKNSLPEMTSEPSTQVLRINPMVSKETQCCHLPAIGDSPLEQQFLETMRLNSKLSEDLGSARKEIEFLKGKLKELEMKQLARQYSVHDGYNFQVNSSEKFLPTKSPFCSNSFSEYSRHDIQSRPHRPKSNGLSSKSYSSHRLSAPPGSLLYAEPLYGCKCTACEEAMGSDIHSALSAALNEELQKFPIGSNVLVQLGDHVVIRGERTGRIRYIGHLDKIGQPNMVFVGLELDAPVGHHDGFFNNKRYFFCQKDHGIFVPLHDMMCKVDDTNEDVFEKDLNRLHLGNGHCQMEAVNFDLPSHTPASCTGRCLDDGLELSSIQSPSNTSNSIKENSRKSTDV